MSKWIDLLLIASALSVAGASGILYESATAPEVYHVAFDEVECGFAQEFAMGFFVAQGENWLNASKEARNLTADKTGPECNYAIWQLTERKPEPSTEPAP